MASNQESDVSPARLAELSALADGSLDPARRQAVEARIAESRQLRELYEREQTVVELLRQVALTARKPTPRDPSTNATTRKTRSRIRVARRAQDHAAACARACPSATTSERALRARWRWLTRSFASNSVSARS
jgi:anti-sigma factor RsiW